MKYGLKDSVIQKIQNVFSTFDEVDTVVLYGSRAKGNYKEGSDIDLVCKGNNLNLSLLNKIELKLDELFLPFTFDLSIYQQIDNPDLINHIDRVGIEFYNRVTRINNIT